MPSQGVSDPVGERRIKRIPRLSIKAGSFPSTFTFGLNVILRIRHRR